MFQPVPFHYLEIAKVLFAEAKDCFGADMLKVHVLSCCKGSSMILLKIERQATFW